jgi:uncharacterized protein (TIGR03435 family)
VNRLIATWFAGIGVAIATATPGAAPYAEGAAPGFTGGFKESACDACHFEADINLKPGQLTISGVPLRYTAGERYELTVTLARPEMKIGGFQLAARFETSGMQAGTLAASAADAKRIKIETSSGIQYANQTKAGTGLTSPGSAKWTLVWTAPKEPTPVVFHAAANAADDDGAARGDYVYTAVARSQAASSAQSAAAPAFEVATVRQHEPGTRVPSSMTVTPSRVDIVGYRLTSLLWEAFKVPTYQLVFPDALRNINNNHRFEIHATIPAGATRAQLPQMLQTLLRDRFGMVSRVEARTMPAYELVVAAGGHKLREVEPLDELSKDFASDGAEKGIGDNLTKPSDDQVRIMGITLGLRTVTARSMYEQRFTARRTTELNAIRMTMAELADVLTMNIDRPVIDRTGLAGVYQFKVELGANASAIRGLLSAGITTTVQGTPLNEPTGVSTFKNLDALGLKLEERRAPIDVIVVDKITLTPTQN